MTSEQAPSESSIVEPIRRYVPSLIAAIGIAAAGGAYLLTLKSPPYWLDELMTVGAIRVSFIDMLKNRVGAGHQPFYFAAAWVWVRVTGVGEVATRLLPCLGVLIGAFFVWRLGRSFLSPIAAALAVLLFLLNPATLYMGQVARPYGFIAALGAILLWAVAAFHQDRQRWQLLTIAAATLLILLTHWSAALIVLAVLAFALARRRPDWPLTGATAATMLLWLPWAAFAKWKSSLAVVLGWLEPRTGVVQPLVNRLIGAPARNMLEQAAAPLSEWAVMGAAAILVTVLILGAARSKAIGRLLLWVWMIPLAVGLAARLFMDHDLLYVNRYWVAHLIVQPLLFAAALDRPVRLPAPAAWGAGLLAVSLTAYSFSSRLSAPPQVPAWPAIAEALHEQRRSGETILTNRWEAAAPVSHYLGEPVHLLVASEAGRWEYPSGHRYPIRTGTVTGSDAQRVWMVLVAGDQEIIKSPDGSDPVERQIQTLLHAFKVERVQRFRDAVLVTLTRAAAPAGTPTQSASTTSVGSGR